MREGIRMKRWLFALAFVAVSAMGTVAGAQEIQLRGPLAGAPPCRRCVQYRNLRFTIAPTIGITLQDEFDRVLFVGGQLNFHPTDWLAIGVFGGGGVAHINTSLTNNIADTIEASPSTGTFNPNVPRSGPGGTPTSGEAFRSQVGRLNWMVAPQVTLIPLRGKLALFQNVFIDTDLYIFGGVAFVGVSERSDIMEPVNSPNVATFEANQLARTNRVAIAPTFGIGLNFFIGRFFSFGVEYRAFPFAWNTMGTDESSTAQACGWRSGMGGVQMDVCNGFPDYQVNPTGQYIINSNDRIFRFNQMVNFMFTFYLPFQPRVGD